MARNRLHELTGNFLFKKANKSYEKRKDDIIKMIDKEREAGRDLEDIIDSMALKKKEDTYWIWLMYVLDMKLELDDDNFESCHFSGKCIKCKNIFKFTETDKDKEKVKCENCGKTYTREDMTEIEI